jgi:uncharacterized OsmC-like protein
MKELLPGNSRPVGTVRVDVVHSRQLRLSATCWEGEGLKFTMTADEPPSRGGDAAGPTPLSCFVMGAATCLLTQFAKLALLGELKIDSLSMTAKGHFDRKLEGTFTDITYDVKIAGTEDEARIEALSREAERQCFASNTLKRALRLVTNVEYNGKALLTFPAS